MRRAALEVAGPDGSATISREQLLQLVAAESRYSEETVRLAIDEHARASDGVLTRLHRGTFCLRPAGDDSGRRRVARDWVQDALAAVQAREHRLVSRHEVEVELTAAGLRYSRRAVSHALTTLVRDSASGVTMPVPGQYRVAAQAASEG